MISSIFVENVSKMYINISYKFHRIPDTQSHFITKVQDLLGQPSFIQNLVKFYQFVLKILQSRNDRKMDGGMTDNPNPV